MLCAFAGCLINTHSAKANPLACQDIKSYVSVPQEQTQDETALLTLTTFKRDEPQTTQVRELSIKRKTYADGREATLIKIIRPTEIQGVGIYSVVKRGEELEQWMFLPQTQQTKRILDSQKQSRFAGSEFTFEDMMPFPWLSMQCLDAEVLSEDHIRFSLQPKTPNDLYHTVLATFETSQKKLVRLDFIDATQTAIRQIEFSDYPANSSVPVRPMTVVLTHFKNNRQSVLKIHKIQFNTGLSEADINLKALSR